MTTDQLNGIPISNSAPPKPSSSTSTSTSTTSLTARLHLPTTYATLPTQWLSTYQAFVRSNSSQVSSLESALRSLTYLLPGTRFADTPLTSESLQTFLSLLTAYNTHLLASPPFSPQRRYERFWEAKSGIYARCAALLRTIQYTQLLLEMLAKRAGEKARWRVIVLLEVVKAVCRLCMGRLSGSRPVIATGIGDERTERRAESPLPEDGDAAGAHGAGAVKEGGEWKMPRTGMRLPQLPSSSPNGVMGEESITDFLTSRVITADEIKSARRLVRQLRTLPGHLAELMYILRPVAYAVALQRCQANRKDWRPWLLGMGMEVAARQLSKADVKESVVGGARGLSGVEREELKRRGWGMAWWGMRGAFYENVTSGVVKGVAGRFKGKAVLDMVGVVVEDYDFLWAEYYFPTATL
ncbi:MAG: Peroxisomal membrane protein pex16 [Alectoria sarmentosa]|nr:MAG: Peroxisomal membrane protein pex16 [Alectoria sarmentosa]